MILLTTTEKSKILIKIKHITSMQQRGDKTHIKIKGLNDKIMVLESIDEIKLLLQSAGKTIAGCNNMTTAELFSLTVER